MVLRILRSADEIELGRSRSYQKLAISERLANREARCLHSGHRDALGSELLPCRAVRVRELIAAKSHTRHSGVPWMDRTNSFHQTGTRYRPLRIIRALFTLIGTVQFAIGGLLLVFGLYVLLAEPDGRSPARNGAFRGPSSDDLVSRHKATVRTRSLFSIRAPFLLSGL